MIKIDECYNARTSEMHNENESSSATSSANL